MNSKPKKQTLLLALIFCVSLFGAPFVYGMIPENRDVEMGAQLIENKIDFLLSSLEEDPDIKISENFKEKSRIDKWIHYAIKNPDVPIYHEVEKTGKLHEGGDPLQANIQLNETIRKLLELVRVHEDLDSDTQGVIDALMALLDASAEAFSRASGIITSAASDPKYTPKEPYALESDDAGNFRYYGKLYNLDSDVIVDSTGVLWFDIPVDLMSTYYWDDIDSPMLTPFYVPPFTESSLAVTGGTVEQVAMSNVSYRRYLWHAVDVYGYYGRGMTFDASAKLFENPDNSIIVFDYYNEADVVSAFDGYVWEGNAGLLPGEGSPGQPGVGQPRDWYSGIESLYYMNAMNTPTQFYQGVPIEEIPYTAIGNSYGGYWDMPEGVLLDSFFVFLPDQWDNANDIGPIYSVTFGTRNLIVDQNSVDLAINEIIDDRDSLDLILGGEFTLSNYAPGFQTVGPTADLLVSDLNGYVSPAQTLAMLDNDGFLAYMVQYEEHLMNQEIVNRAHNADELRAMLSVSDAQVPAMIRAYDDLMEQASDAKAGRVFKDRNGDWVRVQQYILRPDNYTVQLLSLSLRGSGPNKGISGMDFTTTLNQNSPYNLSQVPDLRALPWSDWLNTQSYTMQVGDFLVERKYVVTDPAYQLESMYVEFTNPVIDGSGDTLRESRTFEELAYYGALYITNETLTVNGTDYVNTYSPEMSTQEFDGFDVAGFTGYTTADGTIGVSFNEIADDGSGVYASTQQYKDIWDALRVNVADNDPNQTVAHDIGARSLEIAFNNTTGSLLNRPIDVVYVPMARMLWKNDLVD